MEATPMERCRPMFFPVLLQATTEIRPSASHHRGTTENSETMSMYLDKDSRGVYSLHDITLEELSTILSILSTYRNPHVSEMESMAFQTFMSIEHQLLKIESYGQPGTIPHE